MGKTKIEWATDSWNPIRARNKATGKVGWHCEHESEGCRFCYAEGLNRRLGTGLDFKPGHSKDVEIFLDEKMLLAPLRWRQPRMIFVCSMTDLFADFIPGEWIDKLFGVMALCPQHTFQVLTKRSMRMREWSGRERARTAPVECVAELYVDYPEIASRWPFDADRAIGVGTRGWPLQNVWLGVSCEDQENADARVPNLLATPAAVRFVSAEPLLGPINFMGIPGTGLDWIIVGGESGPKARPMSIQWAREIRDQCAAAGVAFFFKQWGEWRPAGLHRSGDPGRFAFGDYEWERARMIQLDAYPREFTKFGSRSVLERVGKKAAGRLLDGREHNDMPRTPA